ncbi:hypothetical protein BDM02DRAFT_3132089 [Thelephora ganbajun]|uniref:Uncharacterized protein n=1 Tax=Thelephora ganbajun TaxID=370292 RepID=A0ACB6Z3N9_THEGA|nr:hypothetical protein BDM02DRAFT_3132089 [Thelephora ganbajun]
MALSLGNRRLVELFFLFLPFSIMVLRKIITDTKNRVLSIYFREVLPNAVTWDWSCVGVDSGIRTPNHGSPSNHGTSEPPELDMGSVMMSRSQLGLRRGTHPIIDIRLPGRDLVNTFLPNIDVGQESLSGMQSQESGKNLAPLPFNIRADCGVWCTNMGIEECVFDNIKKRGIGKTLRMGEAFVLIFEFSDSRQDKKEECVYDDERRSHPKGVYSLYNAEGHLAGQQFRGEDPVETFTDANPSISIFSSFLPPTIPLEPWIPLSFLGEDKLQVQMSDVDATDLDMRSRLWLLVRVLKFGVQFSGRKLDALLRGDQSGTVVSRAFVCGFHVLGMMSYAGTDDTPAMVRFHARRAQAAWESLAELFGGNDHRACLHAAVLVVSSHVYICLPQMAFLYIQKCCDFIKAGDLQFVPTCGRPPEFSEDLHEILAALSQTIYWANYLFLMRGGPEPHATAKLEREFRHELPQTYPILFKICPLTMRTQGILLVRDAILLLGVLPSDDVRLGLWRQSCNRILESLEEFSQDLLDNIKTFREHDDKIGVDVIGSSCITCLAHLAILYEVISRVDPVAKVEMDNRCDSALQRLGTLTSELHFDEYTYLDLLLGDSWKKSLTVFDARIKNLLPEESEWLRHFQEVIGEMYSDFHARLPDCEPPVIYSLALTLDGTTEESRYPNLMSAEERMRFGL